MAQGPPATRFGAFPAIGSPGPGLGHAPATGTAPAPPARASSLAAQRAWRGCGTPRGSARGNTHMHPHPLWASCLRATAAVRDICLSTAAVPPHGDPPPTGTLHLPWGTCHRSLVSPSSVGGDRPLARRVRSGARQPPGRLAGTGRRFHNTNGLECCLHAPRDTAAHHKRRRGGGSLFGLTGGASVRPQRPANRSAPARNCHPTALATAGNHCCNRSQNIHPFALLLPKRTPPPPNSGGQGLDGTSCGQPPGAVTKRGTSRCSTGTDSDAMLPAG